MEFTFSVLLNFLSKIKNSNTEDFVICNSIFDVLVPEEDHKEIPEVTSRYKTEGKKLDGRYIKSVKETDFELLHHRVKKKLMCHLDPRLFREFIAATREVISSAGFPNGTSIGELDVYSILNDSHVCFSSYLTWLIVFSIKYFANRKEDKINYDLLRLTEEAQSIVLIDENSVHGASIDTIKLTLNPERFHKVFTEHKHGKDPVNSESSMRFFSTDSTLYCFEYYRLEKYIKGIIHKYVYSRAELGVDDEEELAEIVNDAMKEIRKDEGENARLDEILVFAFLECVLNAPKIMSAFEQQKYYGNENMARGGMHILYLPDEEKGSQHQIVFGLSSMHKDLKTAVNKAIDKIGRFSRDDDQRFTAKLDRRALKLPYDDNARRFFNEIFGDVRHRDNKRKKAYAVVIGYTLQKDEDEQSDQDFMDYARKRIQKDIDEIIPYIKENIQDKGRIANMPLHFYFLPFNDVDEDSITIMRNVLE